MIFLGIAIWAVFIYSSIAAIAGSPVLKMVRQTDAAHYEQAAELFDEHGADTLEIADDSMADYLRTFFWRSMIAMISGMAEITIVLILVLKDRASLIVWILLIKQIISFPLEHLQRRNQSNQLRVIRNLPDWFMLWTRFSYGVSAICLLALFLIEMDLLR